ncbi:TSC22 domain family protein 1 isoform X2 [Anarrhichthys ocellatus]|uniref:TSC22 domain family protein 1 isoform X2 n=1 Tax=Anarrhichthys ocellatus TaxID=433405 RepID=UPI0012EDB26F|nr:TSC22 domain family protein 1-like isoform X2 [Anarrhichthys ocellatus]
MLMSSRLRQSRGCWRCFSCMHHPERAPRCAELHSPPRFSLCVSRLRALRSPGEQTPRLPHNNALFFYFYTAGFPVRGVAFGGFNGNSMNSQCYTVAMDLGVCHLRNFSISFLSSVLGKGSASVRLDNSSSGASVVAIDNKIEQAMDLVKSHLMYAVREEVEVLKEQIKELIERNTQLEQENNLLKNLASPEQMAQFQAQVQTDGSPTGTAQPPVPVPAGTAQVLPSAQSSGTSA